MKINNSLEDIALKTAIYFGHLGRKLSTRDSLGRIILGSNDDYYKSPCFVYLFQTEHPEYRKFGISSNPELRSKTCKKYERDLYKELLFSFCCADRITACAIEQALIERPENLTVFASHHLWLRPKVEKYIEYEKKQFEFFKGRRHNTELTVMPKDEVEKIILELSNDWKNCDPLQFFNKHAPERMEDLNNQMRGLLNKYLFVVCNSDSLMLTGKRDLNGRKIVPLEEVPKIYKEIYGKEMI